MKYVIHFNEVNANDTSMRIGIHSYEGLQLETSILKFFPLLCIT